MLMSNDSYSVTFQRSTVSHYFVLVFRPRMCPIHLPKSRNKDDRGNGVEKPSTLVYAVLLPHALTTHQSLRLMSNPVVGSSSFAIFPCLPITHHYFGRSFRTAGRGGLQGCWKFEWTARCGGRSRGLLSATRPILDHAFVRNFDGPSSRDMPFWAEKPPRNSHEVKHTAYHGA
jgi:hypothetical protein